MPSAASKPGQLRSEGRPLLAPLFRPIDITFLVYFRVCFGLLAVWLMWIFHDFGAIEKHYITPQLHFTYYGFDWVRPWPGNGMYWHFAALAASALCIACGLFTRAACFAFGLGFAYVFLLEQARYMNHFYLIILVSLLMCLLPVHRSFSVDALLRPSIRTNWTPAWTLWLLRIQFGIVYFFAGLAKLDADWLQGVTLSLMLAATSVWLRKTVPMVMVWSSLFFFCRGLGNWAVDGLKFHPSWRLIDLWNNLYLLGSGCLGVPFEMVNEDDPQPEYWEAALVVGAVCALCLVYLRRRIRAVEVVS